MENALSELLGIPYPIIEGAMAGLGTVEPAAPVSNAGGLGMITAWMLRKPERLRRAIQKERSMTDNPFPVNFSPTTDSSLLPMREAEVILSTRGIGGWKLSRNNE